MKSASVFKGIGIPSARALTPAEPVFRDTTGGVYLVERPEDVARHATLQRWHKAISAAALAEAI